MTRLHREIFGSAQGEKKHPSLYGKSVKAIKFKSVKQLKKAKRDLGQRTSKAVKVIFVKRRKLPGEADIESDPIVISRKHAPDIVINGWVIQVMEPIDAQAYAKGPTAEEARAIAALWVQFEEIKQELARKPREWNLKAENVEFSPHCGNHDYYDTNTTAEDLQEMLERWRSRYNSRQNASDRVAGWLTAITMTIRIGNQGSAQMRIVRSEQAAKRKVRARWRRKLSGRGAGGKRHHPQRGARPHS